MKQASGPGVYQPPPISIKIINNGNDFSTDNDTPANDNVIQNGQNNMNEGVASFNPPIESQHTPDNIEQSNTNNSGEIDFANLVVRKKGS